MGFKSGQYGGKYTTFMPASEHECYNADHDAISTLGPMQYQMVRLESEIK